MTFEICEFDFMLDAHFYTRVLTKRDVPLVQAISAEIWDGSDYIFSIIEDWIDDLSSYIFGVFTDSEKKNLIAFSRIRWISEKIMWFEGARVFKKYQQNGIGQQILAYSIDYAKMHGAKYAQFNIWSENQAMIKLTQKFNFERKLYLDDFECIVADFQLAILTEIYGNPISITVEEAYYSLLQLGLSSDNYLFYGRHFLPFEKDILKKSTENSIWKRNSNAVIHFIQKKDSYEGGKIEKFGAWIMIYGNPAASRELLNSIMHEIKAKDELYKIEVICPREIQEHIFDLGFNWYEKPTPSGLMLMEKKL